MVFGKKSLQNVLMMVKYSVKECINAQFLAEKLYLCIRNSK
jgi:hypothetical protein